jgi:hypothetical protein
MDVENLKEQAKELRGCRDEISWLDFSDESAMQEDRIWKKALEIKGQASEAYQDKNPELDPLIDQIKGDCKVIVEELAARQPRWQVVHARYSIRINTSIVRLTWVLGGLAVIQIIMMIIQILFSD